jgi:predicted nuclease of predicted toxin-antitoxin system
VKFLIDAQLPPALADWLHLRGHDAVHVSATVGADASDNDVWEQAGREGRILVSKDRDFAHWVASRRAGPRVIWLRLGNATRQHLIAWLEPRWGEIEVTLKGDARLIDVG